MSKKYSQEEKRVKIAEVCGWKYKITETSVSPITSWSRAEGRCPGEFVISGGCYGKSSKPIEQLLALCGVPKYLDDLNAMHGAEELRGWHNINLNPEQYKEYNLYITHLHRLRGVDSREHCATAAQRAEAFGLTLGLWD